jgi:hypothetical protein
MNVEEFWNLVERADKSILVSTLSKLSQQDIIDFEYLLRERIIACDRNDLVAALKIIDGSVSDDSYLYFRCWLIGKGRRAFEAALRSADSISDVLGNEEPDCEALLYVATKAYKIRTGKESEDDSFPRDICISKGLD